MSKRMTKKVFWRLKGLMKERNINYRELSEEIGMGLNTLSDKLNGHRFFTHYEIIRIAQFLEIDAPLIHYYFFEEMEIAG